jgi:ribonucleotide reductase alpha subunit
MTEQETLATNNATDAATLDGENQAQATKSYTQQEVDNMMARMKGSLEKKLLKPYADLGDPEELRTLRTEAEKRAQEQQLKRGEFEKTLQEMAAKKDAEIQKRDSIIKEYKVNTPLLSAAANYKAVAPEQVKALLANQVRLNEDGEVEVVDTKGGVRYTDSGSPLGVDDLVREFLDSNPHFKSASPATTNSKSSVTGGSQSKIDITKLDMKNPEHRKVYAEYRKTSGIA